MARNKSPAPAQNSKPAPPSPTNGTAALNDQQIAERAYQKWQDRGCPIGDDLRDWFEAQGELSRSHQ